MQSKGKIIEMNCLFSSFLIVNNMPFYYSFYHHGPPVIMKHYGARSVGWIESENALIVNGRRQTSCAVFFYNDGSARYSWHGRLQDFGKDGVRVTVNS